MIISTTSLEAYWSFDNDSCHDFSGNGHDLSIVNMAWGNGISGLALFPPDRTILRYAYSNTINISAQTALSISWWCNKTIAATANVQVLGIGFTIIEGVWIMCATGTNSIIMRWGRVGFNEDVTIVNAFDTTLRHYVLTFNLATKAWILYRDGASFANGTLTNTPVMPNRKMYIGNYENISLNYDWVGIIDEVRLYSRVLTPTEVTALYEDPGQTSAGEYIEQAIHAYLSSTTSSTAVAGAVGKRIYFAHADYSTPMPYIVLKTVSDPHAPFTFDAANSGQPRIQISVYDDDRFNALSIAHKVRQKLRFYSGTMAGMTIHKMDVGGTILLREPNEDVYQAIVDVLPIYVDTD